ncbi:transcription factor [Scheffersomyces coipomensis]|uniref:transcription factor n=1 Tax=Scheffersomyces coipomensis TaxID=1788519 RepID=UPI00315C9D35
MESPLNIGDLTTNSISNRLHDTHIRTSSISSVSSAVYAGQKFIQLALTLQHNGKPDDTIIILRRVQDSFVNITQLLAILQKLNHFTSDQITKFLNNEVITNIEYHGNSQYLDFSKHNNHALRGLWIPYDKAVSLALRFDVYEFTKKLFLVDVHEFDELPKQTKRFYSADDDEDGENVDASLMGSPTKKQKLAVKEDSTVKTTNKKINRSLVDKFVSSNSNYPFTLPTITNNDSNVQIANELKSKLGEVFKLDSEEENNVGFVELKTIFQPILDKYSSTSITDIPLDQNGQTALHFAASLASSNLISSFIELGLNSPIRGNIRGESPLISAIQVTNSMEKGNFSELLTNWLFPNLELFDNKKWSFLHHLAFQSQKKFDSSKFYLIKIIEYIITKDKLFHELISNIINTQDQENGDTCLHLAVESESSWFIKIFLELGADITIANKRGIKPSDLDIVKHAAEDQEETNDHIFELIQTSVEFLNKRLQINGNISDLEEPNVITSTVAAPATSKDTADSNSSSKIFQSIQQLLTNTNVEYDSILSSKKQQIKSLNDALHNTTIVTANNRFLTKKVVEKLVQLDNLKLKMANINDRLSLIKSEGSSVVEEGDEDDHKQFDADEPFIIRPIYDRLIKKESVEDLKSNEELLSSLQPVPILKARIKAYKHINAKLESDLKELMDYSELAAKFKKVVSICTGVDINEVDELLDGLLEAVEGQQ